MIYVIVFLSVYFFLVYTERNHVILSMLLFQNVLFAPGQSIGVRRHGRPCHNDGQQIHPTVLVLGSVFPNQIYQKRVLLAATDAVVVVVIIILSYTLLLLLLLRLL